ncbi:UNVERIFIED_CONTAM: EAL domain-containing protein (putative c-di-GMP-specific phosphodiesterase class I) [Brevibacillus sp. OAP136]
MYRLIHLYQPIRELSSNQILGCEALMRGMPPHPQSPEELLIEAEQQGDMIQLDLSSIQTIIAQQIKTDTQLTFINVLPTTLTDIDFLSWLKPLGQEHSTIVFEISEKGQIQDWKKLQHTLMALKQRGIRIAIDDFGAGSTNLRHWVDLAPDFIKTDKYFMTDIQGSLRKQHLLKGLLTLFENTTELIVEGIESEEDFRLIRQFGVKYGQGYWLGRPAPKGLTMPDSILKKGG